MSRINDLFTILGHTTEFNSNDNTGSGMSIMFIIFIIFLAVAAISSVFKRKDVENKEIETTSEEEQNISINKYNTQNINSDNTDNIDYNRQNYLSESKVNSTNIKIFDAKVVIMFILSSLFILLGFFKRFIYEESVRYSDISLNYYVGGDAYNFIINSNHMIAYFILALIFALIACTLMIVNAIAYKSLATKE